MTFVSYAQNFEDIILNRALKGVEKGFYIDVGANDPVADSVTKAFYDAGWRGINIEPVSEWFEKLELDRPEDVNLQVAAGARKGDVTFYEVIGTGLSTMDQSIAEKHAKEQDFDIKQYKVPVVRLASVCEQYVHSDIHFLKIDVEGAEKFVLQGMNLKKTRPWIILVESTRPLTQIEDHEEWESFLLASDYEYCYFDGLNRFYVAKEHHELKAVLSMPPNVFDGFIFSGKGSSTPHTSFGQLQSKLTHIGKQKQALESALQQAEQQQQELNAHLQGLQVEVSQYQESLRLKESKEQELVLALIEKETKQQESNAQLAERNQQNNQLQSKLTHIGKQKQALESALQQAEQQQQELNAHLQGLQVELARHQELLRQKDEALQSLTSELEAAKEQITELHQSNHQWWSMADQNGKDLISARAKVDELNQSSHHWWLESERLNKELDTVYHSKSWVITWPLRKLSQLVQWLFYLPIKFLIWLVRLPKRIARWILVKAIAMILDRSALRASIRQRLIKYPRVYSKFRLLALARGLLPQGQKTFQKDMGNIEDDTKEKVLPDIQPVKETQLNIEPVSLDTQDDLLPSGIDVEKNIQIQLVQSVSAWQLGKRVDA